MPEKPPDGKIIRFPHEHTKEGREAILRYRQIAVDLSENISPQEIREMMEHSTPETGEALRLQFNEMDKADLEQWMETHCVKDARPFDDRTHEEKFELMIACTVYLDRNPVKRD